MKEDIRFTDVVNWSRLSIIAGCLATCIGLGLCHYSHVQIVTKAAVDSQTNWAMTYGEMAIGIVGALFVLVAGWRATEGQTAVVLKSEPAATSSQEDTVEVLIQKLEHRFRVDAANAILLQGGQK